MDLAAFQVLGSYCLTVKSSKDMLMVFFESCSLHFSLQIDSSQTSKPPSHMAGHVRANPLLCSWAECYPNHQTWPGKLCRTTWLLTLSSPPTKYPTFSRGSCKTHKLFTFSFRSKVGLWCLPVKACTFKSRFCAESKSSLSYKQLTKRVGI